MKKFFTLYIFVYFSVLWLAGNVSGSAWSGNAEFQEEFTLFSSHLSDTETHALSGLVDIFDKGENEENLQENNSDVKKVSGVNPFLTSFSLAGYEITSQTVSFVNSFIHGRSLIVLFHAWKFHL